MGLPWLRCALWGQSRIAKQGKGIPEEKGEKHVRVHESREALRGRGLSAGVASRNDGGGSREGAEGTWHTDEFDSAERIGDLENEASTISRGN